MGRLIDEQTTNEAVRKVLRKYGFTDESIVSDEVWDTIENEVPTAYDVDRVVEELKRMSGIQFDGCNESYELNWCISTDSAIEIVKGAVKE